MKMVEGRMKLALGMLGAAAGILYSMLLLVAFLGKGAPTWLMLTMILTVVPLYLIPCYWADKARDKK